MVFKDFIPLIGTVLTVLTGYRLISVQVNKNRHVRWIEDFRKEIANYSSLALLMNKEPSVNTSYAILNSANILRLYLYDANQPYRLELDKVLKEMQDITFEYNNPQKKEADFITNTTVFAIKLAMVMDLATKVIVNEQRRI